MAALVGLLASCGRSPTVVEEVGVARVSPELDPAGPPLLLNEPITVHFRGAMDPLSVTRDSFAVVDEDGRPVRGRLLVDAYWVTFEPEPPLLPDLSDGSFQPGREYELVALGYPRVDGLRSRDGRLMPQGLRLGFRAADRSEAPPGLPAPLRPLHVEERPFLLRESPLGSVPVAADDPRLQLHFSLPILPGSVTREAFEVTLLRGRAAGGEVLRIEPRAVRLLPLQPGDEFAGSTVEVDFGSEVRVEGQDRTHRLQPEDFLGVRLAIGEQGLRDYAGRTAPVQVQWGVVTPGLHVALAEWPAPGAAEPCLGDRLDVPGFEASSSRSLVPLVRVEGGDGALGAVRIERDTVWTVGSAIEVAPGRTMLADQGIFSFRSLEVAAGARLSIVSPLGPVQLRALGRIRIDGELQVDADAPAGRELSGGLVDLSELTERTPLSVVAASGMEVHGRIVVSGRATPRPLALVTAGMLVVDGEVPPGSALAVERPELLRAPSAVECVPIRVRLLPGLPSGVTSQVEGLTPSIRLPSDRGAEWLQIEAQGPTLRVLWQALASHPVRLDEPDLDPARTPALREAADGQRIEAPPGAWLRLCLRAEVQGGAPLPVLSLARALGR